MNQPLHYEKPDATPGWDKSLWPTRTGARLYLNARLESWRVLIQSLLAGLVILAVGSACIAHAMVTLGWIALPPEWTPFVPLRDSYILLVAGVLIAPGMLLAVSYTLYLILVKTWQALRASLPARRGPDYGAVDFRSRRRR